MVNINDIQNAHKRIHGVALETPLVQFDERIWLKDESKQPIGAFKIRGAYNMIAQLSPEQLGLGVITYSSGNHAQGVAYAARALGAKSVIVMPSASPQVKVDATRALGAEVVFVGNASAERKLKAEELAAEHGYTVVPPYDDERIIAGQATCGVEIVEQLGGASCANALILSPVSGGGLLSGVSAGVKLLCEANGWAAPPVWGCEPEVAGDASESFRTRTLVEWPAEKTTRTLADGLRTQSVGPQNFEHILRFTDGILTVTEAELREALRRILTQTGIVAEPSGAVTLAAALFHANELPQTERVVAIVSGGNIDPTLRAEVAAEEPALQS
ncbi:MAG: threonine/serine dehydratase [Acidobacteriaceae bacterium]|nr:threonine/serine dehydratase [Acidobacteriaceae bacterium]